MANAKASVTFEIEGTRKFDFGIDLTEELFESDVRVVVGMLDEWHKMHDAPSNFFVKSHKPPSFLSLPSFAEPGASCHACELPRLQACPHCPFAPIEDAIAALAVWRYTDRHGSRIAADIARSLFRAEARRVIRFLRALLPRDFIFVVT